MKTTQGSKTLTMAVDNVAYEIKVTPHVMNEEQRFNIQINGGEQHVYIWDEQIQSLRALDDSASVIPEALEKKISDEIMSTVVLR